MRASGSRAVYLLSVFLDKEVIRMSVLELGEVPTTGLWEERHFIHVAHYDF